MGKKPGEREYLAAALVIAAFAGVSFLAARYQDALLSAAVLRGPWGMAEYVLLTAAAVVVAPFSTLPLIPVAVVLWGPLWAAVLSVAGWTAGAQIAFELSRSVLRGAVARVAPLERADAYVGVLLGQRPFWTLFLLRLLLPVDVLSYAVGLFSTVAQGVYFWATLLGVTPFAFVFSYAAALPILPQVLTLIAVFALTGLGAWRMLRARKGNETSTAPPHAS